MASRKEQVQKYCDFVCSLIEDSEDEGFPENTKPYTRQLLPLTRAIVKTIQSISEDTEVLNNSAKDIIQDRISEPSMLIGSASVPHMVSMKQLADSLLSHETTACKPNMEEHFGKVLLSAQANLEQFNSQQNALNQRIRNLEFLVKNIKQISLESEQEQELTEQKAQEDLNSNLSTEELRKQQHGELKDLDLTVSTVSSFSESRIAASSPVEKY